VLLVVLIHLRDDVREQVDRFIDVSAIDKLLVFLARDLRVHFDN
jgi:hypothetical protein